MDMTLGDIVLYMIYLGVVTFMVHGHRNINLAYRNNLAIEDVLVNPGCIDLNQCFFFAKVIELSLVMRKPVFGVSDQVRLKAACAATEAN